MPPRMVDEGTFASGRYLKRKRAQVNYRLPDPDADDTDTEAEADTDKSRGDTDPAEGNTDQTTVEPDQSDADAAQSNSSTDQCGSDSGSSSDDESDDEYGVKPVTKKFYPIFKKQRKTKANPQMASRPLAKRKIFPFLKLPAEVRNMIYGYALSDPTGLNFLATTRAHRRTFVRVSSSKMASFANKGRGRHYHWPWGAHRGQLPIETELPIIPPSAMVPQLFATNKQLYEEASSFLYSSEFVFGDTLALHAFLLSLGPRGVSRLKKIRLFNWNDTRSSKAYGNACFALLAPAVDISDLFIDTGPIQHNSPKHAARTFYRDAFSWFEAVGRAKNRADAAIDVLHVDLKRVSIYHPKDASVQEKVDQFKASLRDLLLEAEDAIQRGRKLRRKVLHRR